MKQITEDIYKCDSCRRSYTVTKPDDKTKCKWCGSRAVRYEATTVLYVRPGNKWGKR